MAGFDISHVGLMKGNIGNDDNPKIT